MTWKVCQRCATPVQTCTCIFYCVFSSARLKNCVFHLMRSKGLEKWIQEQHSGRVREPLNYIAKANSNIYITTGSQLDGNLHRKRIFSPKKIHLKNSSFISSCAATLYYTGTYVFSFSFFVCMSAKPRTNSQIKLNKIR